MLPISSRKLHSPTIADSNAELLLEKFKGKGIPFRGVPGCAGYQEIVDFGEHIGTCVRKGSNGLPLSTTKGKIHYSKTGAYCSLH
ncbi:MAG: hypothetical protein H0W50_05395 [Parachlamydiaceae bacterium]|nr:hypothetical protein [Parachlamydiaceae bacterium]